MDNKTLTGKITFIHHEKEYATLEYLVNEKKKTINGNISEKEQLRLKEAKAIKKVHAFRMGDEVSFIIVPSAKGDRMVADNIEFLYNNAFTNLLHKAQTDNQFVGYLKKVEDSYLVKETGSYITFPLMLSPWEKAPHESRLNEPVFFKLNNIDKPNAATASLYKSEFISEYHTALKHYKSKTIIRSEVYKITPHGIFINIVNDKVQGKLPVAPGVKVGDTIDVIISYLSPLKIVIEKAG